jgi:hypothetical protein
MSEYLYTRMHKYAYALHIEEWAQSYNPQSSAQPVIPASS